MLAASWILILFVTAETKRSAAKLVLLVVVASTLGPLALPIGEEAGARAGRSVQHPVEDGVAVRHEPLLLLLKLVAVVAAVVVVVVVGGVTVVADAVVVIGGVEARHGRATVEKSLMQN